MLIDIFFYIIGSLVLMLEGLFGLLTVVVPQGVTNAITDFFNQLQYFGGVVNIPALGDCMIFIFNFLTAWFVIKIVLFFFFHIPFLNRAGEHKRTTPTISAR